MTLSKLNQAVTFYYNVLLKMNKCFYYVVWELKTSLNSGLLADLVIRLIRGLGCVINLKKKRKELGKPQVNNMCVIFFFNVHLYKFIDSRMILKYTNNIYKLLG